ncbi:hypothetical protein DPM33_31920 [Mesorhizobium hawassense]|uniref:Uncharacterized protein n=1 Tax=Mesorhizobium hawassense TaxID=1209954 RepID=A0A330H7P2_9HYPH|nr:hypothetical protein DPM33_31920 [Mesorhizobium hawassense]
MDRWRCRIFHGANDGENGMHGGMLTTGRPRFLIARRVIAFGAFTLVGSFGALALITVVFGRPS